jgi:hypothetical protein
MISIVRENETLNKYTEMYSDSIYCLNKEGKLSVIKGEYIGTLVTALPLDHQHLIETLLGGGLPTEKEHHG